MTWLFLCLTTIFSGAQAEGRPELNVAFIPDELKKDAYSVIRESVTTYQIRSGKSYARTVKEAVTIMDKRSSHDRLRVFYDQHSKAKILYANIYNAAGTLIRKVKKEEISDVYAFDGISIYTDNRMLVLDLVSGQLPYSIDYEYTIDYGATMTYPVWTQSFYESIEKAELHVIHPSDIEVHARVLNGPVDFIENNADAAPVKKTWSLKNRKALKEEAMSPGSYEIMPFVLLAPAEFIVGDHKGSMTDWKDFGSFMYFLNMGRETLSLPMAKKVQSLVANVPDERTKIDILYNYLKQNMRYVSVQLGIGGWQTYDALYVERNKYGDCKALSYFMKGMLKEAGIEAHPILVAAGEPSFYIDDFATPGYFNHMMLHIPSSDVWLECTSNSAPTGYIGQWTADRDALLITPEGGIKTRTPDHAFTQTAITTQDSFYFLDQKWHVTGERLFSGSEHEYIRYIESDLPPSEKEENFREDFVLSIDELDTLYYKVDLNAPFATGRYEIDLAQYGSVSGTRLFLPVNALYRFESPCAGEARIHDIVREVPVNEKNITIIAIPPGYTIESLPAVKEIKEQSYGRFAMLIEPMEHSIRITRTLELPRAKIEAEAYSEMCLFTDLIETADKGLIVLKKIP